MEGQINEVRLAQKPALKTKILFVVLLLVFILIIAFIVSPGLESLSPVLVFAFWIIFLLLGLALLIAALRQKMERKIKTAFIVTGSSAVLLIAGIFLHNLFYALAVVSANIAPVQSLMEALHALFFVIATIVSPIVFLAGSVSVIIFLLKRRKEQAA